MKQRWIGSAVYIVKISLVSLILIAACIFIFIVEQRNTADQTNVFIKRMIMMQDVRQTVLTLSDFASDRFAGISYFDVDGKQVFFWPSNRRPSDYSGSLQWNNGEILIPYLSKFQLAGEDSVQMGKVVYLINPMRGFQFGVGLSLMWLIAVALFARVRKAEMAARKHKEFITELARKTAHDIRAPISVLNILCTKLDSSNEKYIELIQYSAQRLNEVAEELLEQSRSQIMGSEAVIPLKSEKATDILPIVQSALETMRVTVKKNIQIHCDIPMTLSSANCFCKKREIQSIVENVLNNAVEAIYESGQITVSLRTFQDKIQLSIQDDGRGIPSEVLPQLFHKGATFAKADGNGLGLYNAKTAIESWGGHITINSKVGMGTIVALTFVKSLIE